MDSEKEKSGLPDANQNNPHRDDESLSDSIAQNGEKIKPNPLRNLRNPLRNLRLEKGISPKEIVDFVREMYPKYDKMLQSKCENGDKYGIELKKKALDALLAKYSPETLEKVKHQRNGRHKLTNRVECRLAKTEYDKLIEFSRDDGFDTMQAFLLHHIRKYISEKETAFNVYKSIQAQREFCKENRIIQFAPEDGICPFCYRNIYEGPVHSGRVVSGYSTYYAGRHQITGCPHCHHSFVE